MDSVLNFTESLNDIDRDLKLKQDLEHSMVQELEKELGAENIATDSQANYYLKIYSEIESEEERITKLSKDEIDRYVCKIKNWQASEIKSLDYKKTYIKTKLEEYFKFKNKDNKKPKIVKLPFGSLSTKKQQPCCVVKDESQAIAALEKIDKFLNKQFTIDKTKIKKECKVIDGEVYYNDTKIPGIEINRDDPKFTVKIN